MHTIASMLLVAIVALSAISLTATTQTIAAAQTETSTSISGGFADVQTVQDDSHIIITITKTGGEAPTGPIVVPEPDAGENGTIIIPNENATDAEGNATEVIVIDTDGNVTMVPGNVTNFDNSTVIVAPDNQTVTETDGGVVVVDPVPCGCPADDAEAPAAEEPLPPMVEEPVTNDTMLVPSEVPAESEENDTSDNGNDDNNNSNGNGNGSEDNEINNPFLGTPG